MLACEVEAGELCISYANDDFKMLLGIPDRALCGTPLVDVLQAHVSSSALTDLRDAVQKRRRVLLQVDADSALPLTLTLRPAPAGNFWRGALRPVALGEPVRVEAASLRPVAAVDPAPAHGASDEGALRLPALGFVLAYETDREDYRVLHVGESCRALLGMTPDALARSGIFPALARPQDLDALLDALALAARSRRRFEHEFALQSPRPGLGWARIVADPVAADMREVRYAGVLVDATAPRAAYEHLSRVLAADRAQLRASARQLDAYRAEVKQLQAEVAEISRYEQQRIGHDLHDGVGQELTGVSLLLKALEDELRPMAGEFASRVAAIRDRLEQCVDSTRKLAHSLSPIHLASDGLAASLRQLALDYESLHGLSIRVICNDDIPELDAAAAANLYRIVQEALGNAAKHAQASHAVVRLKATPDTLRVEIEDDGIGLEAGDPEQSGAGMGLKIMRYRAGMLGASLEFTAGSAGGTLVTCSIEIGDRRTAGVES